MYSPYTIPILAWLFYGFLLAWLGLDFGWLWVDFGLMLPGFGLIWGLDLAASGWSKQVELASYLAS